MSDGSLVSIIVAVYNGASCIESTINSVWSQSHQPLELIVVDGASADGTAELITQRNLRVDHLISEPDRGIGGAWNKGIRLARGRFIALLNCGDAWPADYIERHLATFREETLMFQYGTTFMLEHGVVLHRFDRDFSRANLVDGFGFIHTSLFTSR